MSSSPGLCGVVIWPANQGVIIITASTMPLNIHISYAEIKQGKETVNCNLQSLSRFNVCIKATTFICIHFCKSSWLVALMLDDDTGDTLTKLSHQADNNIPTIWNHIYYTVITDEGYWIRLDNVYSITSSYKGNMMRY